MTACLRHVQVDADQLLGYAEICLVVGECCVRNLTKRIPIRPPAMWKVIIKSVTIPADYDIVARRLATLLNISTPKASKLLARLPVVVKSNIDRAMAVKYQNALEKCGLDVVLEEIIPAHDVSEVSATGLLPRWSLVVMGMLVTGLLMSSWLVFRLSQYNLSPGPLYLYAENFQRIQSPAGFKCGEVNPETIQWDVLDYSHNVIVDPIDQVNRYKSNLPASGAEDVHVVGVNHGTGRIVMSASDKPVILFLMSAGFSQWFIEIEPGANLKKIIVHPQITELRLEQVNLNNRFDSQLDFVLGGSSSVMGNVQVQMVDEMPACVSFYPRFQSESEQARAKLRSKYLEQLLGSRELSLQVAGESNYFSQTFKIPMKGSNVSKARLESVYHYADAMRKQSRQPTTAVEPADPNDQYRTMLRDSSVRGINKTSVDELLDEVRAYQEQKRLPSHIPQSQITGKREVTDWLDLQAFRPARQISFSPVMKQPDCNDTQNLLSNMLAVYGDEAANRISCARGNQIYVMGEGNDVVEDSWGDDFIYAGPGNDQIDAGWGNDIVYFNFGWGEDVLDKTCHLAWFDRRSIPAAGKYFWDDRWQYKNFIVFGPDIDPEDVVLLPNKIVHKITGDSIVLKSVCFNVVFLGGK